MSSSSHSIWKRVVGGTAILGMVTLGLAGTAVQADDVPVGNSTPTIGAVRFDNAGTENAAAATVLPYSQANNEYEVEVDVTDANSLEDVATVVVCLRKDTTANCATPNTQTNTSMKFTRSGTVDATDFTIQEQASSSWDFATTANVNAVEGVLTGNTGTYVLGVRFGDEALATDDINPGGNWIVDVTVTDDSSASANNVATTREMGEYRSIGARPAITTYAMTGIDTTSAAVANGNYQVITNDGYDVQYAVGADWTLAGNSNVPHVGSNPTGFRRFALLCEDGPAGVDLALTTSPHFIGTAAGDLGGATAQPATDITPDSRNDNCAVAVGTGIAQGTWTNAVTATVQRLV